MRRGFLIKGVLCPGVNPYEKREKNYPVTYSVSKAGIIAQAEISSASPNVKVHRLPVEFTMVFSEDKELLNFLNDISGHSKELEEFEKNKWSSAPKENSLSNLFNSLKKRIFSEKSKFLKFEIKIEEV